MAEDPDPTQYLIVSLEQKRKDQTKPYDGKKMVWVPDAQECFLLGNITSTKGDMVTVDVGKGEEVCLQLSTFGYVYNLNTYLKINIDIEKRFIFN
jgi:hypothetical protein